MTTPQPCPEGIHGHIEIDPDAIKDGRVIPLGEDAWALVPEDSEDEGEYEFPSGWQEIGAIEDGIPLSLRPRGTADGMGD